jgi:hypothetical protein
MDEGRRVGVRVGGLVAAAVGTGVGADDFGTGVGADVFGTGAGADDFGTGVGVDADRPGLGLQPASVAPSRSTATAARIGPVWPIMTGGLRR